MSTLRVFQIGTFQAEFDSYGGGVYNDLDLNPGTTATAMATRLALDIKIVRRMLSALESQLAAVRETDDLGAEFWWSSPKLALFVISNYDAARVWIATKDGVSVNQMAIDLNVHFCIAKRIAGFLQSQGAAKLIVEDA